MAGFFVNVTDSGRAALISGDNMGTNAHRVVEIGVASAPFKASRKLTRLPNERKRIATFGGEKVASDTIHVTLQDNTADKFTLYGFGLYLENGLLVAAYGQMTPIMEKSADAVLMLSVDIRFESIDVAKLTFGNVSFSNPPATTKRKGVIELATQAEVDQGTNEARAVTPRTAARRYAALAGADFKGPVSVKAELKVNRDGGEGQLAVGSNDGYFFANNKHAGWYSVTHGHFYYDFALQNLTVGDKPVWHSGNVDPLDKRMGGAVEGDVKLLHGAHLSLPPGSPNSPSLAFGEPGASSTGLYHNDDGALGIACGAVTTVRFTSSESVFDQPVRGPAPAPGDNSDRFATTSWITSTLASTSIGQIVVEARTSVRAGFVKLNGVLLNRSDYPALWAYAQAGGALVSDEQWQDNCQGNFSAGDGSTTFRIPDVRGEFLRCWDDGRGVDSGRVIGSLQGSQNLSHEHTASASESGEHGHQAWTDAQGHHAHGIHDPGHSHPVNDPGHAHNVDTAVGNGFIGLINLNGGGRGAQASQWAGTGISLNASGTGIAIHGDGAHGHNIGIGVGGNHSHALIVGANGGAESRPRNVALLAMIRAY